MRVLSLVVLLLAAPLAAAEQRVDARGDRFEPERTLAGDWETVRWSWPAGESHGVMSTTTTGEVWCEVGAEGCTRVFPRPGEYRYHCPVHPEMRGAVVVERRGGEASAPLRAMFFITTQGLHVTLDASPAARSRTAIESFEWDFGDGSSGAGRIVQHDYARAGVYIVHLTLVDEFGNEARTARQVRVSVLGDPLAYFQVNATGRAVLVDAVQPNGSHTWDFGDGARIVCDAACADLPPDTLAAHGGALMHVYARGGEFFVNHTLASDDGSVRSAGAFVTVEPEETFEVVVDGLEVTLNASALPRYGEARIAWLFGDVERASGEVATHRFPRAGLWSIAMTLSDERGTQTIERDVLLDDAPAAPSLDAHRVEPEDGEPRAVPWGALVAVVALALASFRRSESYK